MIQNNIRLAWENIKTAKLRNFLTMLGVIIGVASVVTTVSLGEGVRQQVGGQVEELGTDLIIVRPGNTVNRDTSGEVTSVNLLSAINTSILTNKDLEAVTKTKGVQDVAPLTVINGVPMFEEQKADNAVVVSTSPNLDDMLNQKLAFGSFLTPEDEGRYFMVIGDGVANQLFKNSAPLGRSITFRDQKFTVKGVLEEVGASPLSPGLDFNNAIFISQATGEALTENTAPIFQIFTKPADTADANQVRQSIQQNLEKLRAGQSDFTVLRQEETVQLTNNVIVVLTALTAAIAAVSLIVGGIGIMNVMLVSISERKSEIGIRKALGATDAQILWQFMVEAIMLTVVGSIIGILIAIATNVGLRLTTNLTPVITVSVILIAIAVALLTGILFGVLPAIKAARKDPITALRNE